MGAGGRIWFLATVLLISSGAQAQEASDYRSLIREGVQEFEAGNWVESYNLFKSAHDVTPSARTLRGMGIASYELKQYPRALEQLNASLDSQDKKLNRRQRRAVKKLVERASRLVGTLDITLRPPEAELFVNDQRRDGHVVVVPVGDTSIRARLKGYEAAREMITVDGAQVYPITLELQPEPQVEATPKLSLAPTPKAEDTDDTGLLKSPWLWLGVGAAVVAGVVIAGVALSGGTEDFPDGNVGLSATALRGQ